MLNSLTYGDLKLQFCMRVYSPLVWWGNTISDCNECTIMLCVPGFEPQRSSSAADSPTGYIQYRRLDNINEAKSNKLPALLPKGLDPCS